MPGNPVKLSATPTTQYAPPPNLGQHTDDILKWLVGATDENLEIQRKGVI